MNEMSELETQLLSWKPRRPSKALEQRLFGAAEPAPADPLPSFRLSWMAPAAVAGLLLCVLFNQRFGASFSDSPSATPMVAMILSNQSAATYMAGNSQSEQNNLPADAFKWTAGRRATARLTAVSTGRGEH